ncbi:cysteine-rich CWC family protein ['Paenibacillus yunnanensis' Narsing Rao et al. 2020]|uniref:cysteine-rich CWC family protein n=1 Tax=Paenibacillus tengchongensis TaxID=2608684 RepID=UPI00124CE5E3|nr:cysteine-rich CWC family protein [Paenibacillus tengchongensis]
MHSDNRLRAEELSAGVCPVCRLDNGCAMVHNRPADTCWCMTLHIPEGMLKRIKEDYPGSACICKNCLQELAARMDAE